MDPVINELKVNLRSQMRLQRRLIQESERGRIEIELLKQVQPLLKHTFKVAIYHALGSELGLKQIIEYCKYCQMKLYQPIAYRENREMRFEQITEESICHSLFYPNDYPLINETKCYNLDLVFVPLLAVDRSGYRLGQGGGYYDTTFAKRNEQTILCGIGLDCQFIEQVPHDSWDLQLDYFASEKQLIKFK